MLLYHRLFSLTLLAGFPAGIIDWITPLGEGQDDYSLAYDLAIRVQTAFHLTKKDQPTIAPIPCARLLRSRVARTSRRRTMVSRACRTRSSSSSKSNGLRT